MYLQKPMQGSVYAARKRQYQGRSEGGREAQFPWHRITMGAPNHCGVAEKSMSQVLSLLQCICSRKIPGLNMGAPNLLVALGAI